MEIFQFIHSVCLKLQEAFKLGSSVSLDQRVFSLLEFKWQPLADALLRLYPRLYPIHDLSETVSFPALYKRAYLKNYGIFLDINFINSDGARLRDL